MLEVHFLFLRLHTNSRTFPLRGVLRFAFTCKRYTEVTALVKEVEGLRRMVEDMTEKVAGLRFEDKGAETECRVTKTGVNQDREEAAENIRTEEMITGVEDEGDIRTEERKEICAGAALMATHAYATGHTHLQGRTRRKRTLEAGRRQKWTSRIRTSGIPGVHPGHDSRGGESDATKKEQENSTGENRTGGGIGQEGERRKSYSATVIDGIKRNSRIYVGESIVRKTDSRLNKGEHVVVCLPGARIEHVMKRVEQIMGRGNGGSILVHVGTNNADKEGTTAIVEKYRNILKKTKQARVGQIILPGIVPVFGNRIRGYRNSKRMAVNGMVKRI